MTNQANVAFIPKTADSVSCCSMLEARFHPYIIPQGIGTCKSQYVLVGITSSLSYAILL